MSVAPNSRASFCRDSWRLIAMIRSAPSCRAASTPSRPTAPSPTTATVLPGSASAATASEPAGAEHVGGRQQARDQVVRRLAGGGDQGAVGSGTRSSSSLGADRAHELARARTTTGSRPGRSRQVLSEAENEPTTKWPGLIDLTVAADLLDDADVLVPHRRRPVDRLDAAVGPQVRPADAGGDRRMMASVGSMISGSSRVRRGRRRGRREWRRAWQGSSQRVSAADAAAWYCWSVTCSSQRAPTSSSVPSYIAM